MKRTFWWLLTVALLLGVVLIVFGETVGDLAKRADLLRKVEHFPKTMKDTLEGLKGVYVVVENVEEEARKYGLTKEVLQKDVELRLRQSGIPVLSKEELNSDTHPASPILDVYVDLLVDPNLLFVCGNVSVTLSQKAILVGPPSYRLYCGCITWSKDTLFLGGLLRFGEIRETVKELVDQFCNDYLAVNPKD